MLAALRQSGVEYHYDTQTGMNIWNYEDEIKEYREAEREAAQQAEFDEIQASWI